MANKAVKRNTPSVVAVVHNPISVEAGTVVVLLESSVDSEAARQIMTQQVMRGGAELGIQFPKSKIVREWHTGGEHHKAYIKAANCCYPEPPVNIKRAVRCVEVDRGFKWLSYVGWMNVEEAITGNETNSPKGDWNIFLEHRVVLDSSIARHYLIKLRQATKAAGNHLMVIIEGVSKLKDTAEKLHTLCDEVITIEACESDQDTHSVFKIAMSSPHHSQLFGKSAVMASLVRGQEEFNITVEPFIAKELEQRVASCHFG